jgi:cell division protein FtsX
MMGEIPVTQGMEAPVITAVTVLMIAIQAAIAILTAEVILVLAAAIHQERMAVRIPVTMTADRIVPQQIRAGHQDLAGDRQKKAYSGG